MDNLSHRKKRGKISKKKRERERTIIGLRLKIGKSRSLGLDCFQEKVIDNIRK